MYQIIQSYFVCKHFLFMLSLCQNFIVWSVLPILYHEGDTYLQPYFHEVVNNPVTPLTFSAMFVAIYTVTLSHLEFQLKFVLVNQLRFLIRF